MTLKGGNLSSALLILISTLAPVTANLNVAEISCADDYAIKLQSVSFACDDQCQFGVASTVSSSLSYYNVSSTNLYLESHYKFEAWANSTFSQLTGGNIAQKTKFTEYLDLCDGSDDCSVDGGAFDLAHNYSIPSTGNMDGFYEGFNVTSRLLFYSADYGNIIGECEVLYTTNSLYTKKSYNDDTDDLYYAVDDDAATVYQYIASQSSWYMKSFIYATAAFLGVYAGTQVYAKSGLCRKIEMEEDDRREKLMINNSVSMSCNSDDVERLQQDIQSRIHIFKEKIPWPQVDSVKLVHEESIPWPEDGASDMSSYVAAPTGSTRSASPQKSSPKKSPRKSSPKKKELIDIIPESKSTVSEFSKASTRDIEADNSKSISSSKSSGSRIKKLFKKK